VATAKAQLRALTETEPVVLQLKPFLGHVTAAVLLCIVGSPNNFGSASAYVKAMGLNLKVHSSGKHKGKLRISKRGSGVARKYLYLAALRAIQRYPLSKAWYDRKVVRDGGVKGKAIIAIMRKLARAAFHVGRGSQFDEQQLFDARLLKVEQAA
jgi:transposase